MSLSSSLTPQWESSKENILPTKSGRSARGLNNILSNQQRSSTGTSKVSEREIELLKVAESSMEGEDPLQHWVAYCQHVKENNPKSSTETLLVLEKITNLFKQTSVYKNDMRYVAIWIEYADLIPTPGKLFNLLNLCAF